jgi:dephospho-CoA kinase
MGYTSSWDDESMENAVKIIGLTGNIATGKSVIRRMLANSGVLGLDADVIAHRTLYPGGSAYQAVLNLFGDSILSPEGQINRQSLGDIVFSDPHKLQQLESIVHPAVETTIRARIQACACPVVVIEAIKLLESGLSAICDSIWVSHASIRTQVSRLINERDMAEVAAQSRIAAQPSQSEKLNQADVVINTGGSFRATWRQIQDALGDTINSVLFADLLHFNNQIWTDAQTFIDVLSRFWKTAAPSISTNLYEALGACMVLPICVGDQIITLTRWKGHNFTAALQDVLKGIEKVSNVEILPPLERHARLQQCEILILSQAFAADLEPSPAVWGFRQMTLENLTYPAWQEAAGRVGASQTNPVWVKELSRPFELEREETHF